MRIKERINTLVYRPRLCTNCGLCSVVCPQGVFEPGEIKAKLVKRVACIECGACMLNCEPGAIEVQAGVGCAAAMIQAALTGQKEPTCGSGSGCEC